MDDEPEAQPQRREERDATGALQAEWWVIRDAKGVEVHHGEFTAYHPNGQRREHGFYDHGTRVGPWYGWAEDGRRIYDKVHDPAAIDPPSVAEPTAEDWDQPIETDPPKPEEKAKSALRLELMVVLLLVWLPAMVSAALTPGLFGAEEAIPATTTNSEPLSAFEERVLDYTYVMWELPAIAASIQVIAPVLLLVWMRRKEIPLAEYGLVRPQMRRDGIWTAIAFLLGTGIPMALAMVLPTGTEFGGLGFYPHRAAGYAIMVVSLLLNSVAEELVWRGYMIPRLKLLTGSTGFAAFTSTALFASYHLYQGPNAVLEIFIFGLIYAVLFLRIKRLWPLIIGHTVHNVLIYCRAYEALGMTVGPASVG